MPAYRRYGVGNMYSSSMLGDCSQLPLDRVTVAGSINLGLISTFLPFVENALAIITDQASFLELLLEKDVVSELTGPAVSSRYSNRWRELLEFGLIETSENPKFLSSYFEVPKLGETPHDDTARAIFNGRRLSARFRTPTPMGLGEIPEMLRTLQDIHLSLNTGHGRVLVPWVIAADLRHFFHEITLAAEIRPYFSLRFQSGIFRWKTLPMGWSWSPRIAQCLAWGILFSTPPERALPPCLRVAYAELHENSSENPPQHIFLHDTQGRRKGLLFIWIDNVTAISWCKQITNDLTEHLRILSKWVGCVWKEIRITQPCELLAPSRDSGSFLGVQLGVEITRRRSRSNEIRTTQLIWRHPPKKIQKWSERLQGQVWRTRRDVAALGGMLVWHTYLGARPFSELYREIDLLRQNAPARHVEWDHMSPLSPDEIESLLMAVRTFLALNPWLGRERRRDGEVVYCASDSDDSRGGSVFFASDGSVIDSLTRSMPWDTRMLASHIFVKELLAAVRTCEQALASYPNCGTIVIAVDNTAAIGALRKGFSSSSVAMELINRLHGALRRPDGIITLVVVGVRGHDNIADCPSRAVALEERRRVATFAEITSYLAGRGRQGEPAPYDASVADGLGGRHEEEINVFDGEQLQDLDDFPAPAVV
jgi:hypothetical protein